MYYVTPPLLLNYFKIPRIVLVPLNSNLHLCLTSNVGSMAYTINCSTSSTPLRVPCAEGGTCYNLIFLQHKMSTLVMPITIFTGVSSLPNKKMMTPRVTSLVDGGLIGMDIVDALNRMTSYMAPMCTLDPMLSLLALIIFNEPFCYHLVVRMMCQF